MEKILITICGRAGSKGFKNKNLKTLLGVPLVYYTLTCANYLKDNVKDAEVDICVNTDSEDLIALAESYGSELHVIRRPEELCGDVVDKVKVFRHSLHTMESRLGKTYDYLIDMDITSPLRTLDDALNALEMLRARPDAEQTLTGCPGRRNPYFNMLKIDGEYVVKVINVPMEARQQAPRVYDMNASIYVQRTSFLREEKQRLVLDAKNVFYEMYDTGILDIDSEEDFELMQVIAAYLFAHHPGFAAMYSAAKSKVKQ